MVMLALLLSAAQPGLVPVAYNCMFPREGNGAVEFDELAIFIPRYLVDSNGTSFEVLDPSNLLRGRELSTLLTRPGNFLLTARFGEQGAPMLVSVERPEGGVFDVVLGFRGAPERREGRCGAMGENPREAFDSWKADPSRIGERSLTTTR